MKITTTEERIKHSNNSREIIILPNDLFFVELTELPIEVDENEIDSFAELNMEGSSPFPIEQLNWGFRFEPNSRKILLFATHRDRLKNSNYKELESYLWVLPEIAVLPDINSLEVDTFSMRASNDAPALKLLKKEIEINEAGLPTFKFEATSRNFCADAKDSEEISELKYSNPPSTHEVFAPNDHELWRADVRSVEYKKREKSRRSISARITRFFYWASIFAIFIITLECILLGTKSWTSRQESLIAEQSGAVSKIEEQRSLINKLEQMFQNEVRPVAILGALNTVRPRGIYFTSTTTTIDNNITIEGVAQTINELNNYIETLKGSGQFSLTQDPKSLTRSGKTTFTMTLAYTPAKDTTTVDSR